MFKNLQNQKGFSLIELLVVVVIIAILAAIAVPIYMSYVNQARSTEAQSAIAALRQTYRVHYQTYGSTTDFDIETALNDTNLGNRTEKNWEFEVVGNPPKKYMATSTAEFAAGEGKQVWYDVDDAKFHGYGIDEEQNEEEILD
ncbi:MAG: prepilin-type N-terminal cleavage/methylation domain-containing protein [Candidatus Cloacimonetes bacterium]|jgi:prepilin-type N-terminal cleavage/methylation domain-containing protein|nr:prepilin-type N-terminal cleavage/methylation domain-containing protein [Candidatus Cloacimonadota bacterium]